jgi:hypothetical protein
VKQEVQHTEDSVAAGLNHLRNMLDELRGGSAEKRAIVITMNDSGDSFKLEMSSFNMTPAFVLYALLEAVQMLGDQQESEHSAPESLQ